MEEYKKNLINEFRDIYAKVRNLNKWLKNHENLSQIDFDTQDLMRRQLQAQKDYLGCLIQRMALLDLDLYA